MPRIEAPKETQQDKLKETSREIAVKAIDAVAPGIGGFLEPFIRVFLHSNHSKNLEKWREEVSGALNNFQNFHDAFPAILTEALQIALRTHSSEKLNALKNALINSAKSVEIDFDFQSHFIHLIDILMPTSIHLLKHIQTCDLIQNYSSLKESLNKRGFDISLDDLRMYVSSLIANSLVRVSPDFDEFEDVFHSSSLLLEEGNQGLLMIRVTDTAKEFLIFIENVNQPDKTTIF